MFRDASFGDFSSQRWVRLDNGCLLLSLGLYPLCVEDKAFLFLLAGKVEVEPYFTLEKRVILNIKHLPSDNRQSFFLQQKEEKD
jgi:hypothetical protein